MWIGRVESNFRNPSVKVWADLDWIHLREVIMQSYVCRPPWMELCQNVISQEDNSSSTLYIDFEIFKKFLEYKYSFWSSSFINACTFISDLTYLSIKEEGRYIFMKSKKCKVMYVALPGWNSARMWYHKRTTLHLLCT